jgi:hypothetical protein
MVDILKAMGMSASVLLPVVILTLIISIVTVKRGVIAMGGGHDHAPSLDSHAAAATTAPAAAGPAGAAAKKVAAGAAAGPPVGAAVLFGVILFGLAVLLLLGYSIIAHA